MGRYTDAELGMDRRITRRDFLDGAAVAVGAVVAGTVLGGRSTAWASSGGGGHTPYPPALQGLRGYQEGSQVVPHSLRDGTFWDHAPQPQDTCENYDLVVVGGGISGLAAARFYQKQFGADARILVLDALDDIGGHARRNEFRANRRTIISYGGSQSLESPSTFAAPARWLLRDVDIQVKKFEGFYDFEFTSRHGLGRSIFFDEESWGRDHLAIYQPGTPFAEIVKNAPMAAKAKRDLALIYDDPQDWMPGMTDRQKKDVLADITYLEYLQRYVKAHPDAQKFLQTSPNGNWGYGADAVGALDASIEFVGFDGLGLDWSEPDRRIAPTGHKLWTSEDDYIYHFPEGNAGVVYSLVRRLIPEALPGQGMTSIPSSRISYDRLDRRGNRVRMRLSSPVVRVRHEGPVGSASRVEVAYVHGGRLLTVHADHVVLACNNQMIPYLTTEISARQRDALHWAGKLSLMYTSVLIRNWRALDRLKVSGCRFPTGYWGSAGLDFPVSMGDYRFASESPGRPTVLHMAKSMCKPGLPPREQGAAGRVELLKTPFEDMERHIRTQLVQAFGGGGFDPARDILGITVNRWAHAYAYEYGRPWDTFWPDGELPSHVARKKWGRVAVANTDSAPRAYVDSAIDMAYRAVRELAGKSGGKVARGVDGVAP